MNSQKFFIVFGKIALIVVLFAVVSASAFYFGIKSNQKQTTQTSITPSVTTTAENPTPLPTVDQTSVIKVAIKNALIAEHGSDASALTITVSKSKGTLQQVMPQLKAAGNVVCRKYKRRLEVSLGRQRRYSMFKCCSISEFSNRYVVSVLG